MTLCVSALPCDGAICFLASHAQPDTASEQKHRNDDCDVGEKRVWNIVNQPTLSGISHEIPRCMGGTLEIGDAYRARFAIVFGSVGIPGIHRADQRLAIDLIDVIDDRLRVKDV